MAVQRNLAWQKLAIYKRSTGDEVHGCAAYAGVTTSQLQWSLHNDQNFRKLYDEAGVNAPKKPQ